MNFNYYLLNKNDITKIEGIISRKELLKEMSTAKLNGLIQSGMAYKGKYILVEEEFKEEKKEILHQKICKGKRGTYYATTEGDFYVVYHESGVKRPLKKYAKKTRRGTVDLMVSIANKHRICKNLMAECFIKKHRKGDTVICIDGRIDNLKLENLKSIPKEIYAIKTGAMSKSKPVGLFENDELVKKWGSTRKAAKDLFCSYQMVSDICNNAYPYKNGKEFDLRWI